MSLIGNEGSGKFQFKIIAVIKGGSREYYKNIATYDKTITVNSEKMISKIIHHTFSIESTPINEKQFNAAIQKYGVHRFNFFIEYEDGNRVPYTGKYYNKIDKE